MNSDRSDEIEGFLRLNEAMALRQLFEQILCIDRAWQIEGLRLQELAFFDQLLTAAALHRCEKVRQIARYRQRFPSNPTYHQFMSIWVPLEREYARGVSDGDFIIRDQDRAEVQSQSLLPVVLILDNIRSAFNLGSIWRTAECLGVEKIYITGYTATPEQKKVKAAALGTEDLIAWEWHPRLSSLLLALKEQHYHIAAMETSDAAKPIDSFSFVFKKTAILLGNERYGLESETLEKCDSVLEISCYGRKNSMNVAVAAGIVLHELRRQWYSQGYLSGNKP